MSYAFTVRGASIALAVAAATEEMERVAKAQPSHERDCEKVVAAIEAFAGLDRKSVV